MKASLKLAAQIMIDSVVLKFEQGQFTFVENGYFDATSIKHMNQHVSVRKLFSNAYRQIKKEKRYFPVITPTVRTIHKGKDAGKVYTIEVQVSLPKLLYGTNLWEVEPSDLARIYSRLQSVLKEVGIGVTIENIRSAVLKRVDFSKSIRLPSSYGSARTVIKQLSFIGHKQRSDMRVRDYLDESDGVALKFHNLTQGYCIYDKFGEIIANGYTDIEMQWVDKMKELEQKRNLIRFELSLQRQQSLDAFLSRRVEGKKKGFTLADVMDKELSRKILLEVFDDTFDNLFACMVSLVEMRENDIERLLIEQNLTLDKHSRLSYLVNMAVKIGVQPALLQLKARSSDSTFRRYKKDVLEVISLLEGVEGESPYLLSFLRQKHEQFELITPSKR